MNKIKCWLEKLTGLRDVKRRINRRGLFENDMEHMYLMASLFLALEPNLDPALDRFRTLQLILVHDQVELLAGDEYYLTKSPEKHARESAAADKIFVDFPHLRECWDEFEERKTPESIIAKKLDIIQAVSSLVENNGIDWKRNKVTKEKEMAYSKWVWEQDDYLGDYLKKLFEEAEERRLFYE